MFKERFFELESKFHDDWILFDSAPALEQIHEIEKRYKKQD